MKAIITFLDDQFKPIRNQIVCQLQDEPALDQIARLMMQGIEGPHVCQCGGKCQGLQKQSQLKTLWDVGAIQTEAL